MRAARSHLRWLIYVAAFAAVALADYAQQRHIESLTTTLRDSKSRSSLIFCRETNERHDAAFAQIKATGAAGAEKRAIVNAFLPYYPNCQTYAYDRDHGLKVTP